MVTYNKPIISRQGMALVVARKEGKFVEALMRLPRHKRRRLKGEALIYSLWEKKAKQRVLKLNFPMKKWEITMKDNHQAWAFGTMLAGASHSGIWFPNKKKLTADDVITAGSPNKKGIWFFLMWDSNVKTFIIQKYHVTSTLDIVPTRESSSVDAVDYLIPMESKKPKSGKNFLMKSKFEAKIKRNPFAMFELHAKNVSNLAEAQPYNIARNPSQDYRGYIFSKRILFDTTLSYDLVHGGKLNKFFDKASGKGSGIIVSMQEKIPIIREKFKKKKKKAMKKIQEEEESRGLDMIDGVDEHDEEPFF